MKRSLFTYLTALGILCIIGEIIMILIVFLGGHMINLASNLLLATIATWGMVTSLYVIKRLRKEI